MSLLSDKEIKGGWDKAWAKQDVTADLDGEQLAIMLAVIKDILEAQHTKDQEECEQKVREIFEGILEYYTQIEVDGKLEWFIPTSKIHAIKSKYPKAGKEEER